MVLFEGEGEEATRSSNASLATPSILKNLLFDKQPPVMVFRRIDLVRGISEYLRKRN